MMASDKNLARSALFSSKAMNWLQTLRVLNIWKTTKEFTLSAFSMVSLEFANVMETMDLTKEEIKGLTLEELFTRK